MNRGFAFVNALEDVIQFPLNQFYVSHRNADFTKTPVLLWD